MMDESSLESTTVPPLATKDRHETQCNCNGPICLAYFLAVLASLIIVRGAVLYMETLDRIWLVLPVTGLIVIFVGSCLYRCGMNEITRRQKLRQRRQPKRTTENLFQSQLSLNMRPQWFCNSRVINSNGHTYLMLPVDPNTFTTTVNVEPSCSAVKRSAISQTSPAPPSSSNIEPSNDTPEPQSPQPAPESSRANHSSNSVVIDATNEESPPSYNEVFATTSTHNDYSFQTL